MARAGSGPRADMRADKTRIKVVSEAEGHRALHLTCYYCTVPVPTHSLELRCSQHPTAFAMRLLLNPDLFRDVMLNPDLTSPG